VENVERERRKVIPPSLAGGVLVYGAGGFSKLLTESLHEVGISVLGFIDRGANLLGRDNVFTILDAFKHFGNQTVVVGVFSPQPDIHEIVRELKIVGFSTVLTPPRIAIELSALGGELEQYWLSASLEVLRGTELAASSKALQFADEKSFQIYDGLLSYRLTGDVEYCPRPDALSEQYVASDLQFLGHFEDGVIIDCGAYTGDSIKNWQATGLSASSVVALEPDPHNFRVLANFTKFASCPVIPIPLGASYTSGHYEIHGSGASARLVSSEVGNVTCVAIDDIAHALDVGMIKMDIEGGELEALRGGVTTIQRCRPLLAISVYHRPSDLWMLASWIRDCVGACDFHLRCYGHQGYDTVLYCVPR
jgi:FkbM family methyltransferase